MAEIACSMHVMQMDPESRAPEIILGKGEVNLAGTWLGKLGEYQGEHKWMCFISHHQKVATGFAKTLQLLVESELERRHVQPAKVWLDICENANEEGMQDGVLRSAYFILFMTPEVLTRRWCLKEVQWALQYRKQIIIVYHTDPQTGGRAGSFSEFYLKEIERVFCAEDRAWIMMNTYVEYHHRGGFDREMLRRILRQMPLASQSDVTGIEKIDQDIANRAAHQSEKAKLRKREAAELALSMHVMQIDLKARSLTWDPETILGRGASASVHPCTLDGADVAVKAFRLKGESVSVRARMYQQLAKEVKSINKVQHENVLKMLGVAETADHLLLVMDRWQCSAKEHVEGKFVPKSQVLSILAQAARGLQAIHEKKYLHRDVKGQNVLVREAQGKLQVCVCDFGIAKLERLTETTALTGFKGTAAFMAPEQLQDLHLTLKADIYSLGMMMWELATGLTPWEGQQPFVVMYQVVNEQKRPPIELVEEKGYSDTFIELMEACWHQLPAKRPKIADVYKELWSMHCFQQEQEHLQLAAHFF
jgi:serine/threonine protein kinase